MVLVSHLTLSVVIPNFKRKRKRKRVQPERREHHALTRIINTKGRVDRDSLYIYVLIVPDNNNNNTINTINTNEDDDYDDVESLRDPRERERKREQTNKKCFVV